MGTYYKLVNVTKREQYTPSGGGIKYGAFFWSAPEILHLLLDRWAGDQVHLVNDAGVRSDLYEEALGYDSMANEVEEWTEASDVEDLLYTETKAGDRNNGVLMLLETLVRDLGPEKCAVMLDKAIEAAAKESK